MQSRIRQYLVFLSIVAVVLFLVSLLIFGFFWVAFGFSAVGRGWGFLAMWGAALLYIFGEFLARWSGFLGAKRVGALIWGVYSIAFSVVCVAWPVLLLPIPRPVVGWTALGLIGFLAVWGAFRALRPVVFEHVLRSEKLPANPARFSLVHLGDVHLDGVKSTGWLRGVVEKVNAMAPDVILITGDLIDAPEAHLRKYLADLRALTAKHGVFAVTGNHEYYAGAQNFYDFAQAAGIRVLTNESASVGPVQVVGVPDKAAGMFGDAPSDLAMAMRSVDRSKPVILMRHEPIRLEEAARLGVDLQLSGHTHAGQIIPWNFLVRLSYRFAYGWGEHGNTKIYTTSGVGTWGPPLRVFRRSEIVKITLTR